MRVLIRFYATTGVRVPGSSGYLVIAWYEGGSSKRRFANHLNSIINVMLRKQGIHSSIWLSLQRLRIIYILTLSASCW